MHTGGGGAQNSFRWAAHLKLFCAPPPPPNFSGRQPQVCCLTCIDVLLALVLGLYVPNQIKLFPACEHQFLSTNDVCAHIVDHGMQPWGPTMISIGILKDFFCGTTIGWLWECECCQSTFPLSGPNSLSLDGYHKCISRCNRREGTRGGVGICIKDV